MNKRNAFSLVELSIVLVILGLLVGGILAGQSLIRASELRAVNTEYQKHVTAIGAFRDKYFAIPGDMSNAQSFWGVAATCPGISSTAAAGVCNGNGDGLISFTAATSNEMFGSWEHLANAGLVEGTYTGNSGDTTAANPTAIIGTNVPRSKMNGGGWTLNGWGSMPVADPNLFDGNYGNAFLFGATMASNTTGTPLLKPEEAWNIDTKVDDGMPATGRVRSPENAGNTGGTGCSNLAASTTVSLAASAYSLANRSIVCALFMMSGY